MSCCLEHGIGFDLYLQAVGGSTPRPCDVNLMAPQDDPAAFRTMTYGLAVCAMLPLRAADLGYFSFHECTQDGKSSGRTRSQEPTPIPNAIDCQIRIKICSIIPPRAGV